MTIATASVPLILEASISAQMILFAGAQAAGVPKFGALRGLLALLTGSLGLAVAINVLATMGVAEGLRDLNLFLEPICAAAIYLYVAKARTGAPPLEWRDAWHVAPAAFAFAVWKLRLIAGMDAIMLTILTAYAAATIATVVKHRTLYRPTQLKRFVVLLVTCFALLALLRAAIAYEAQLGIAFRDSGGYLALLGVMLTLSSTALLVELRYPNLLSAPSSYLKYGASAPTEAQLRTLDERFRTLMERERPHLQPETNAETIAAELAVPERHLSQLANARYRMTVPALLNTWRVEEAARRLRDPDDTAPITTIMYDAGFGSKSAFQREFQRAHGVSPTEYRNHHRRPV